MQQENEEIKDLYENMGRYEKHELEKLTPEDRDKKLREMYRARERL